MHPLLYEFFNHGINGAEAIRVHVNNQEERVALRDLASQYKNDFHDEYLMNKKYIDCDRPHTYFFWDEYMGPDTPAGFNSYYGPNDRTYEFDEFMAIIGQCEDDDQYSDMGDVL